MRQVFCTDKYIFIILFCLDVDTPCSDFDHGTPLHICATHLGLDTAKVLLQNGANPRLKDDLGRVAAGLLYKNILNHIMVY